MAWPSCCVVLTTDQPLCQCAGIWPVCERFTRTFHPHAEYPSWGFTIATSVTLPVINALRYASCVIQSFGDADTERVWRRERVRRFSSDLQRMANRKLLIIDAAETVHDLGVPPGNRLERLKGDRAGQYSIRINDQWRICFVWTAAGAADVEITDCH